MITMMTMYYDYSVLSLLLTITLESSTTWGMYLLSSTLESSTLESSTLESSTGRAPPWRAPPGELHPGELHPGELHHLGHASAAAGYYDD